AIVQHWRRGRRSLSYHLSVHWTADVMRAFALAIVLAALGMPSAGALAQEFNLAIRNHKFEPQEIRVPAGKRVSIYVTNEDPTPEEFERATLTVANIIP